jgi:hypothetical protein
LTCKGTLSGFIDWRYIQSWWYFRPSFLNCFPSNLLSGSTLSHPSPLSCVNKSTVYKKNNKSIQCVRGYGVLGLRQITPAAKSIFRSIFEMTTFCIAFYESYLSTNVSVRFSTYTERCIKIKSLKKEYVYTAKFLHTVQYILYKDISMHFLWSKEYVNAKFSLLCAINPEDLLCCVKLKHPPS